MTIDWKQLAALVRIDLDRAILKERQRRLMEIIVKATLVRGRLRVRVPRLADFEHLLGVTKGNLSVIFRELQRARILQVRALAEGGMEIVILPDARNWDVVWRYERSELQVWLRGLDAFTGQVQGELLPPEPSLDAALAEVSAEFSVPNLGTNLVPNLGTRPKYPSNKAPEGPVPDLGTKPGTLWEMVLAQNSAGVPNLGTPPKGPSNKADEDVVPKLGTNFEPVPDLGTGGKGGSSELIADPACTLKALSCTARAAQLCETAKSSDKLKSSDEDSSEAVFQKLAAIDNCGAMSPGRIREWSKLLERSADKVAREIRMLNRTGWVDKKGNKIINHLAYLAAVGREENW